MAAVTPRKRKRSSEGLQFSHGNPVKKLMMAFPEELPPVAKEPCDRSCASPGKQASTFRDKENCCSPQRPPSRSQRLDVSPLQTANVPKGTQRERPQTTSPESGAKHSSVVPTGSFYSKGKLFLNLLERKLANESHPLGLRNDGGNLPVASKTEAAQLKVMATRKPCSKTRKRPAPSRQPRALPKSTNKKAKLQMAPLKPVEGKEVASSSVEKKMEAPFKVLSMKFKPALKLQTGAAFFSTGRKVHSVSKKGLSSPSSLPSVSKALVKGKQDNLLTQTKSSMSAESKAADGGKKGSYVTGTEKEDKQDCVEDDGTLAHTSSQHIETVCESSLLQDTELQTQSDGLKVPDQKETETRNQVLEEKSQSSRSLKKDENTSFTNLSNGISKVSALADSARLLFSTPFNDKKRPQILPDEPLSVVEVSPVVQNIPAVQRTSKKTKELSKGLKDQMVIDAGQKHFGATVCKSCGMVYSAANPEDEAHHLQYHQRLLEGIKYVSWKNEHVVAEFWDGKIVLIMSGDPKYVIKKAEDVRELVDNELGFKQTILTNPTQIRTYLFVSNERKIIGCLIAEPVGKAFQVLSEPTTQSPTKNSLEPQRAWCCSTKPEKVFCGISRIWVFSLMRRKHIASRMVDVLRQTFCFGSYLSTNEIAFSDPTPDGKLFAVKYCQTPNFLVYNFIS
ncbi:N-acetyltransferase ESCO2 [Sceloporus undulatus]|uniref:N-acetyltransferase ESCO2 n=1 Tax=Sceloporus undulatus TaxID=8520 RepID=UPI001C4CBA03|nr:N-acetyltransferase ESCO2 [Sceloporus undulatus]